MCIHIVVSKKYLRAVSISTYIISRSTLLSQCKHDVDSPIAKGQMDNALCMTLQWPYVVGSIASEGDYHDGFTMTLRGGVDCVRLWRLWWPYDDPTGWGRLRPAVTIMMALRWPYGVRSFASEGDDNNGLMMTLWGGINFVQAVTF